MRASLAATIKACRATLGGFSPRITARHALIAARRLSDVGFGQSRNSTSAASDTETTTLSRSMRPGWMTIGFLKCPVRTCLSRECTLFAAICPSLPAPIAARLPVATRRFNSAIVDLFQSTWRFAVSRWLSHARPVPILAAGPCEGRCVHALELRTPLCRIPQTRAACRRAVPGNCSSPRRLFRSPV